MSSKKIDVDDLTMDAISLENAICGLESFIHYTICDGSAKIQDISALSGLIVSINLLAKKHAAEMSEYGIGS